MHYKTSWKICYPETPYLTLNVGNALYRICKKVSCWVRSDIIRKKILRYSKNKQIKRGKWHWGYIQWYRIQSRTSGNYLLLVEYIVGNVKYYLIF